MRRDRRLLVGGLAWVALVQFFVMHLIVQSRWPRPYSWRRNWVSDLGKVKCGASSGAGVTKAWACSPWHVAMDVSFVLTGVLILTGAVALRHTLPADRLARMAHWVLVTVGAGWVVVGFFPGDAGDFSAAMHVLGALMIMPMLNVALVLLGASLWRQARWNAMGTAAIALGIIGFACVFLVTPMEDAGWNGIFQRTAMFPQMIWLIVYGANILRSGVTATTGTGPTPTSWPTTTPSRS